MRYENRKIHRDSSCTPIYIYIYILSPTYIFVLYESCHVLLVIRQRHKEFLCSVLFLFLYHFLAHAFYLYTARTHVHDINRSRHSLGKTVRKLCVEKSTWKTTIFVLARQTERSRVSRFYLRHS